MRIWHQSFIVLEDVPAYTDRVRQHIDRVKHPGTVVDLHGPVPGTYSTEYPGVDLGYSFLFGMHTAVAGERGRRATRGLRCVRTVHHHRSDGLMPMRLA
jgi:hypothetical protein